MASSCEVADCDQIDRSHIPLVMVGTKNGGKTQKTWSRPSVYFVHAGPL